MTAAVAPAPLPFSTAPLPPLPHNSQPPSPNIPLPPKLSDKLLNLHKTDRYFINVRQKSHGRQWVGTCLDKAGLISIGLSELPHAKCAFFWLPREYIYLDSELFCAQQQKPLIGFIPSQGLIAEKTKFAENLFRYYKHKAWDITPVTLACHWHESDARWVIPNTVHNLLESKGKSHMWITKSSMGSLGSGVHLFRGNSVNHFSKFIHAKYNASKWGESNEAKGWRNTDHIELKAIVLQEYIGNPLLYNGKFKFDLRVYALVASTNPCIVMYHVGKMRVCGVPYRDMSQVLNEQDARLLMDSDDFRYQHLSNCKIQRNHENYDRHSSSIDGQTMLNDWNDFVKFMFTVAVRERRFGEEWFEGVCVRDLDDMKKLIDRKCCRLFSKLYSAAKDAFDADSVTLDRPCQFAFHGNDVMIDGDGKFYLIEVNRVPSISLIGHKSIKQLTKDMLKQVVDVLLEIRGMKLEGKEVDQDTELQAMKGSSWLRCRLDYKLTAVARIGKLIEELDMFV